MHYWTDGEVARTLALLKEYSRDDLPRLMQRLSADFGRRITQDQVQKVLRRRGLGPMTSMCKQGGGSRYDATDESQIHDVDVSSIFVDGKPIGPGVARIRMEYGGGRKKADKPELSRLLIVSDCHHPAVDETAWAVLLEAGRVLRPTHIIVLGDFCDFGSVSAHRKNPLEDPMFDTEISAGNAALDSLDALGAEHKFYICGNHEDRLQRAIADHMPALYNTVRWDEQLRLKERGWSVTRYGQSLKVGKVFYAHDPSGCGRNAHRRGSDAAGHPIGMGHTHRAAIEYSGNIFGEKRVAAMFGWLGDPEKATYLPDLSKKHEWMHSFGVGFMEKDGSTHLQLVPIVNGRAVVCGQIVGKRVAS